MSVVRGYQLNGVEEIFGIKRIRAIDVRIAADELVTAKVEFLLDEIQANAFLQLCKDGKWRSPECKPQRRCVTYCGGTFLPIH